MYGYLPQERLFEMYQKMDIAIGTLALYRKKMKQASPLKVREYLAFGLPTIIGYDDADLRGLDCVLKIPNEESGVENSLDQIRDFVYLWKNKSISPEEVYPKIDITIKEQNKMKFLASVFGKELDKLDK